MHFTRVFLPALTLFILCGTCFASADQKLPLDSGCSVVQVDGISDRIVDQLWSRTDYWWHHGDYPRIIALDRLITEADPHFLEPYATGGWLMESLGNNSNAEWYYKRGCANNPHSSYLYHNLGFFYFNTLHDYPKAIDAFTQAVAAPDHDINSWKMLAHSYDKNKEFDKEVDTWHKINTNYPNNAIVILNMNQAESKLAAQEPVENSAGAH